MFDIFGHEFFWLAVSAAVIIGFVLPAVGVFVVLRGFSLIADMLAHVTLTGIAISSIFGGASQYLAIPITTTVAVGVEVARSRLRLPNDIIIAMVLYISLSVSLAIFSLTASSGQLTTFLFGSIFTTTLGEIWVLLAVGIVALIVTFTLVPMIMQIALDEDMARLGGIRVGAINMTMAALVSVMMVVSVFAMGVLLVGALVVIPATTILRRSSGMLSVMLRAGLLGAVCAVSGVFTSYYFDIPPSSATVLIACAVLALSELQLYAKSRWAKRAALSKA